MKVYNYDAVKGLANQSVAYAGMFQHESDRSKVGQSIETEYKGLVICLTKKGKENNGKLPEVGLTVEQAQTTRTGEIMLKAVLKAGNKEIFARGFANQWSATNVGQAVPCTYELKSFDVLNSKGEKVSREAIEIVPVFLKA